MTAQTRFFNVKLGIDRAVLVSITSVSAITHLMSTITGTIGVAAATSHGTSFVTSFHHQQNRTSDRMLEIELPVESWEGRPDWEEKIHVEMARGGRRVRGTRAAKE